MLKAILLDMDGVLIDSPKINFESFNKVLAKYGVEILGNQTKKYLGRSLRDQLAMWKEDFPAIPKDLSFDEFAKEAFAEQIEIFKHKLQPDQHILDFVDAAKQKGLKVAVATSSTKERAHLILEGLHLADKLDAIITVEDVAMHKPHPEIFSIDPKECLVIEDALNGIEAANAADMISVAKLTEFHGEEDFEEADYFFKEFADLKLEKLESLFDE